MSMWGRVSVVPIRDGFLGIYSDSPPNALTVHARLLTGFQPYGPATAGSNAIAPRLVRSGMPLLGATVALDLLDAVGGALGVIGVSFAGPQLRPFGPATVLLADPVFPVGLMTSGNSGVPGVGTAHVALSIPNAPAFSRIRVNLQGLVLDAGSPAGFSATAGLEMWVQ
jgi:hypothetical protein